MLRRGGGPRCQLHRHGPPLRSYGRRTTHQEGPASLSDGLVVAAQAGLTRPGSDQWLPVGRPVIPASAGRDEPAQPPPGPHRPVPAAQCDPVATRPGLAPQAFPSDAGRTQSLVRGTSGGAPASRRDRAVRCRVRRPLPGRTAHGPRGPPACCSEPGDALLVRADSATTGGTEHAASRMGHDVPARPLRKPPRRT